MPICVQATMRPERGATLLLRVSFVAMTLKGASASPKCDGLLTSAMPEGDAGPPLLAVLAVDEAIVEHLAHATAMSKMESGAQCLLVNFKISKSVSRKLMPTVCIGVQWRRRFSLREGWGQPL